MYHRLTNCRNMFAVQKCFQHLPIYILSLICISSGAGLQFKNSNIRKALMKCCYFLNLLNDFFRNCFIFHSFTHLSQFAFIRVFKMSLSSFGNSNVTNSIETDNNNDEKKITREKKLPWAAQVGINWTRELYLTWFNIYRRSNQLSQMW